MKIVPLTSSFASDFELAKDDPDQVPVFDDTMMQRNGISIYAAPQIEVSLLTNAQGAKFVSIQLTRNHTALYFNLMPDGARSIAGTLLSIAAEIDAAIGALAAERMAGILNPKGN